LGLPFSTGATPLSLDIGAILGGAHTVTVSIQGFAMDTLDEDQWKKAFLNLGPDNIFYKDTLGPNRLLAENAVKVTGLKAVFDFSHDLSADVSAQFKGETFTLGNNSGGGSPSSSNPAANANTNGANSGSNPTGTNNSTAAATGSCGSNAPGNSVSQTGSSSSSGSSTGNGSATFHIAFSGRHQITICADGPFYIIAAYSNLINGTPIGIAPTQATIHLTDATLPINATAATDRQPFGPGAQ
jgi:hypothetical protein